MGLFIVRRFFAGAGVCLFAAGLSGCSHTWAPGPGVAAIDYGPTSARYRIMARHGSSGVSAYGSPRFVAGAVVASVVADAFRANADFNDCMQANGFVIADGHPPLPAGGQAGAPPVAMLPNGPMPVVQNAAYLPPSSAPESGAYAPAPALPQMGAYMPQPVLAPDPPEMANCLQPLRANLYYEPLLPHLPDLTGQYSAWQLSDPALPTPAERTIAASYQDMARPCMDGFIAEAQANSPAVAAVMSQAEAQEKNEIVAFVSGGESWGDYAKHDLRIREDLAVRIHGALPM